jgi:Cu/Ag efflux protein CusF
MNFSEFLRASVVLAAFLALAGCGEKKAPVQRHPMHGVVQSVDAGAKTATIQHGDIPGFMGPMTMEYAVRDPAALAKLHKGEKIDATVFVQDSDFWVGEIQEAK